MPLKDVLSKRTGQLARLGVIRLGYLEPNKKGDGMHPVPADHFVLKDAEDLIPYFESEPTELPVRFPYVDFDRNIEAFHRCWVTGLCVCKGDGDVVHGALPFKTRTDDKGRVHVYRDAGDPLVDAGVALRDFTWNGKQFHKGDTVPCPGSENPALYPHCECCAPSIVLKVMIDHEEAIRFGYYQVSTRSLRNYLHFVDVMDEITEHGRVEVPMNAVPFLLRIAPATTTYQDEKKVWQTTEKYFLQLEVRQRTMRTLQAGRERRLEAMLTGAASPRARGEDLDAPRLPGGPALAPVPEPEAEEPPESPPWAHPLPEGGPHGSGAQEGEFVEEPPLVEAPPGQGLPAEATSCETQAPEAGPRDGPPEQQVQRPYTADQVLAKIATLTAGDDGSPASEKQIGLVAGKLEECFAGGEDPARKRHSVLKVIFGFDSAKILSKAQAKALLSWLLAGGQDDTGDWPLHPAAPKEAAALLRRALLAAGQGELPM